MPKGIVRNTGDFHMIISIGSEEAFDNTQHPFMIKTLSRLGLEGTHLNMIKTLYNKATANMILSEKRKAFPLRS